MQNSSDPPPRNVLPDLIIPTLAVAFAIYYLTTIREVPWIAQASAMLVSVLLLLSILAFAIRTFIRIRAGREYLGLNDGIKVLNSDRVVNSKRAVLLISSVLYVLLLPVLGFSLATFLLIFTGILVLSLGQTSLSLSGIAVLRAFLVSLICTVIAYLAFIHLFKTRFPFGPIENLLKGWL